MIKLRINPLPSTTYHLPTTNRGFTIIELVIVITIMAILLTLGVVNLRGSQANGRDAERKVDIETIAQHLETYYSGGTESATALDYCESSGDTVTNYGLYTVVHKFTTVGTTTLTCPGTISAEMLVVGGGGGGTSGGGGGGGVFYNSTISLAAQPYTVTVGGGGNGGAANGGASSTNGGNSVFNTITAIGGGRGGQNDTASAAVAGGSGGGGGSTSSVQTNGGAGTAGQGYSGGTVTSTYFGSPYPAAGGGGGGSLGGNPTGVSTSGNGGLGVANSISGTSLFYGGGGGGGTWSNGIHGSGGSNVGGNGGYPNGTAGVVNSGGGGGGGAGGGGGSGGAGGSGVVIIRYLTPNGLGTYPSTLFLGTLTSIKLALRDIDLDSLIAPGLAVVGDDDTAMAAHVASTFIAATCSGPCVQTTAGVTPQPTKDQYVYQPLHSNGSLCNDTTECRKFNLYYRQEVDNNVIMVSSINQ